MITKEHLESFAGARRAVVSTLANPRSDTTPAEYLDLLTTSCTWLRIIETLHGHVDLNAESIYEFARDVRRDLHPLRIVRGSTEIS